MRVEIGKPVITADGKQIGRVARLIVGQKTDLQGIIVHHTSLRAANRVVDLSVVDGSLSNGAIHLTLSAAQSEALPAFIERQHIAPATEEKAELPYPLDGIGGSAIMWRSGPAGMGFHNYYDVRAPFESAPVDAPSFEIQSSIDADSIVLSDNTDVVGSEGKKLGVLAGADFDAHGEIQRFIARIGSPLQHFKLEVLPTAVVSGTHHRIRLGVPVEKIQNSVLVSEALTPKPAGA